MSESPGRSAGPAGVPAEHSVPRPRVAIIDGPVQSWPGLMRVWCPGDPPGPPAGGARAPSGSPAAAHAQALADALLEAVDGAAVELLNPVIFADGLRTGLAAVIAAIDDLAAMRPGPALVLCAFGLPRRDDRLDRSLSRLAAQGRLIVASAPARGAVVWPAAHPAVIAVQGDARCRCGDWSWLDLPHACFGADPSPSRPGAPAGASIAAARFAGLLLAALSRMPAPAAREWMRTQAAYVGREHRDGRDSR